MSADNIHKPPYIPKPYKPRNIVPFGWITFKEWILNEADKHNASYSTVYSWIYRDKRYPNLKIRRVNKRVVFVKV